MSATIRSGKIIPAGKFRTPAWLREHRYGPNVYLFRNLETNQVLYTQVPFPQVYNIRKQFQNPNWQNRLPSLRRDLWRPMAVAQTRTYEGAVDLYSSLVQLRHMRDRTHKGEAMLMRKKNDDGNIWYFSQFRPTYTQEAIADVISSLEHLSLKNTTIHWEDSWRRGDESQWEDVEAKHTELPRHNPRERHVVLRQIADKSYAAYYTNLNQINKERMDEYAQGIRLRRTWRPAKKTPLDQYSKPAAGGPAKKTDPKVIEDEIARLKSYLPTLMSRARKSQNTLHSLPVYDYYQLKKRLRAESKQEFAVLRRVQRELERYKKVRATQKRIELAKKRMARK